MARTEMRSFAVKPFEFVSVKPEGNRTKSRLSARRDKYAQLPKARSGHRIVTDDDGNIYSFGGYNPHVHEDDEELADDLDWIQTKPLFKELWKFDMTTKTWKKLTTNGNPPSQLASHCAVLVNRHILVYGGTGVPFGLSSSNQIYTCNLDTLKWELIIPKDESMDVQPVEQYGQAIAFDQDNGCLYVVGGTTGYLYTIDVHKFDLHTRKWTQLYKQAPGAFPTFPEPRYRHEVVLHQQKLYIFGGGTADACFGFSELPVFDLRSKSWEKVSTQHCLSTVSHPRARRCHGCVQQGHDVYIVGGTDGSNICSDIWRLDMNNLQWSKLNITMPLPVYFHGTSISPAGQMTVFGGVNSTPHNQRNNELYTIWLGKPPLKELAWQALLHYSNSSSLSQFSAEELVLMGIPLTFVQRLLATLRPPPY